ncbi:MAG: SRPBCC family protein [Alphaproteobacteria bacterium]|nr:SRPBCC family protein [Alphaproteobacteria bacterium]
MSSCRIRAEARSSASPAVVFGLLTDVESWSRWGSWERTGLESEAPDGGGGVGAVRRLESVALGRRIVSRERVEEVVPDERLVYALLSGLPLRDYRGVVELTPDDGGTRITWSSSFDPQVWGTGWLYRAILQRFVADTATALARAAEVG